MYRAYCKLTRQVGHVRKLLNLCKIDKHLYVLLKNGLYGCQQYIFAPMYLQKEQWKISLLVHFINGWCITIQEYTNVSQYVRGEKNTHRRHGII